MQGDVAAGKDAPEHEGLPIHVVIESDTSEPRLGIGVMTQASETMMVLLSAQATADVRALLC